MYVHMSVDAYRGQERVLDPPELGVVGKNVPQSPHRLECLVMRERYYLRRIRKCNSVGVCMALLEELRQYELFSCCLQIWI